NGRGRGAVDGVRSAKRLRGIEDVISQVDCVSRRNTNADVNRRRNTQTVGFLDAQADTVIEHLITAAGVNHDAIAIVEGGRATVVAHTHDIVDRVIRRGQV